jgi:pilus assembly protein CpaC
VPAAISMTRFFRLGMLGVPFVLAVCAAFPAAAAPRARAMPPPTVDMNGQTPMVINISPGRSTARIVVPVDKSRIVHFDRPFSRVHVGSGDIAEVVPLSSSTIYLLGKKRGSTNLTITSSDNSIVAVVDVIVSYDVDGLRQHLADLLPTESVEIQPAGDALVLSGHVSSSDHLRTIMAIADRYAPGAVTNLLSLSGSQQVLLEVKFAEVQRSALLQLGLDSLNGAAANNGIVAPKLDSTTTAAQALGTVGGLLTDSKTFFLRGQISALEQSGMVRTLAEPNVVALSGETATFLAGGEFPIPVVQASTGSFPTTTIQYKDFGVGLAFTPTVISSDTIDLVLKSEVSAIDNSFVDQTNGINVPGLKVRRATTTVELRNGQSFAIAGLIQDDFNDTMKSLPGVGSIPIIGALLRSTNYQRNQTELVVFITVHLVGPGPATNIALPTDRVIPPTPAQAIGLGHNEETRPPPPVPGARSMNEASPQPEVAITAPANSGPQAMPSTPAPSAMTAAPTAPVIIVPAKPAAARPAASAAAEPASSTPPPPDVMVAPEKPAASIARPAAPLASIAPPAKTIVTAALEPVPMPTPKPSLGSVVRPATALKTAADAKPVARKINLALAKPAQPVAHPATARTARLPAADEELPVTAPASIKAFRDAEAQAAAQPDSSGTPAP